MIENTFRKKLDAGEPTLGTHFMLTDPDVVELIGGVGHFDYGEFTAEYAAFDLPHLYHLGRAGDAAKLPLMIKPDQASQAFVTQGALGAGFHAVLFTDIRTAEDVLTAHRILRPETPSEGGHMGVKLRRAALGSYNTDAYIESLNDVVFCIMIEKHQAVENLSSILDAAVAKGVDMVQWGPADYSLSVGDPALQRSKEIIPIETRVIQETLAAGLHPRIEIGSPDQATRYIDLGVRHFCIGWDRFILRQELLKLGESMRAITAGI